MAVLAAFNESIDVQGRLFAPLIERGADPNAIPRIVPLPTTEALQGFSSTNPEDVAEMSKLLGRYGFPPADQMAELQSRHLAAFDIVPGHPRYAGALEKLRGDQSGRALLSQSRRTQEQYQTLKAIEGDVNQTMIRLAEGDNPCDLCEPLDGTEKKYKEFVADNELPGGSSCEGGDNCLCTLTPVE